MIRVATDVGGTFTDLISYDDASGAVVFSKSLTTVEDQSIGVLDAIEMAEQSGLDTAPRGYRVLRAQRGRLAFHTPAAAHAPLRPTHALSS